MKKYIFIIWFAIIILPDLKGQQIYFSRKYNFTYCSGAVGILTKNNGFISISDIYDSNCRHSSVALLFLDSIGNTTTLKSFGIGKYFNYEGGSLINTKDSGYAGCGWVNDTTYISVFMDYDADIVLWKFKANGDTEWVKRYLDTNNYAEATQCKQTRDGGYILTGLYSSRLTPSVVDIFLLKTDSAGNIQWEKTYSYGGSTNNFGYSVDLTTDGGFLIGGGCKWSTITGVASLVIKTDSAGNVKWQSLVSTDVTAFVAATPDGGGIVACPYATTITPWDQLYVLKYSSTGAIQWQKKYGISVLANYPAAIYMLSDSNFIIAGQTSVDSNQHIVGFVSKIDWVGNMKWYGTYDIYKDTLDQNYLRDIKQTPDGGYVACGFAWPNIESDSNHEDVWVLKLDSNGCDSVGHCPEVNTGENEVKVEEEMVKVYPNPTSGRATLAISYELSANCQIEVFNVFGQCVYSSYKLSAMSYELDLSGQPNGVYFYRVTEIASPSLAMTVGTGKIVIEK